LDPERGVSAPCSFLCTYRIVMVVTVGSAFGNPPNCLGFNGGRAGLAPEETNKT
jgi:hypothetical protein